MSDLDPGVLRKVERATSPGISRHEILRDMEDSAGTPRDLTNVQIATLKQSFEHPDIGLWHFSREIFGFRDLRWDLHGELCQLVGHWGETHLRDGAVLPWQRPHDFDDEDVVRSFRRIMISIPRETFKTSLFTRANCLWTLAKDSEATVGIFNEKQENVISWVAAILQVIESSVLFQVLWRDRLPKGVGFWDQDKGVRKLRSLKWGGTGFMLERQSHGVSELSCEPQGIGGAQAGKHYTHKILDDIIGLAAKDSPAVMGSAIEWIDHSRPLERPAEGGCEIINHTRWAHGDVYAHIQQKWPGEYLCYRRSLLEDPETGEADDVNGVSIFPEKISTRKAYRMKDSDEFVFSSQYQNLPKAGKAMSFQSEWNGVFHVEQPSPGEHWVHIAQSGNRAVFDPTVRSLECEEERAPSVFPLRVCDRAIILDPAPGKLHEISRDPKARNGVVVVAIDPWGRKFCLEAVPLRGTPNDVLAELITLYRRWSARRIAIEAVNFSAVYMPLYQTIVRLDPQYQDVSPQFCPTETKGRDKHQRIRDNLIPDHENGLWHYNTGGPAVEKNPHLTGPCAYLLKEIGEFPYGEALDLIDALSYTKEVVFRPTTEAEKTTARRLRGGESGDRGQTGYGNFF